MYYGESSIGICRNITYEVFMARFSHGLDAEQRLVTMLQRFGCKIIERDPTMDHRHKIDFVVAQLPEFPMLLAEGVGVQVTTKTGDSEKQADFFRRVSQNPYAPRNVYLELATDLDLENGGAFVVLVALASFVTDQRYKDKKWMAISISGDLSIEIRDVPAAISAVPKLVAAPAPVPAPALAPPTLVPPPARPFPARPPIPIPPGRLPITPHKPLIPRQAEPITTLGQMLEEKFRVTGKVTSFDPATGFGFIASDEEEKRPTFFFHIKDCEADLSMAIDTIDRSQIDPRGHFLSVPLRVRFMDGGQLNGKKYPKALHVALA